jgi:hypothetical protein
MGIRRSAKENRESAAASPAAERNKDAILAVLQAALPASGSVLEIASGTGQHVAHFGEALPALQWQPSDRDADLFANITQLSGHCENVAKPIVLDVNTPAWPISRADAIVCINMIHISPPESTMGLLMGAARTLPVGAPLVLYGPFRRDGAHTAASNIAFDQWLQSQNPTWGVRDLETIAQLASGFGFQLETIHQMPANNLTCIFHQRAVGSN